MTIGATTFPPRQHANALVRAAWGLAHGVSGGAAFVRRGCGVATSVTMVGSSFLRDGGGRYHKIWMIWKG
jgi:hypothetical protein